MPEEKRFRGAEELKSFNIKNSKNRPVNLAQFAGFKIKRATKIGNRVIVKICDYQHLLVFENAEDYGNSIIRAFRSSAITSSH